MSTLIIAEKPSVARAIVDYLTKYHNQRFTKHPTHQSSSDYTVSWCVGHILENLKPDQIDPALTRWSWQTLPFFFPEIPMAPKPETKAQFQALKGLISKASVIINAGDPDREGQLLVDEIFYHLRLPQAKMAQIKRLLISDLTPHGIDKAWKKIKDNSEYFPVYQAALARSNADYLLGMNVSRAASLKAREAGYQSSISIGRVVTPVLGLIVERELEIRNFVAHPFYNLEAQVAFLAPAEILHNGRPTPRFLLGQTFNQMLASTQEQITRLEQTLALYQPQELQAQFTANIPNKVNQELDGLNQRLQNYAYLADNQVQTLIASLDLSESVRVQGRWGERVPTTQELTDILTAQNITDQELRIINPYFVEQVLAECQGYEARVAQVKEQAVSENPPLGYDLSTLQQEMFNLYKIPVATTLKLVQSLYEEGYVTYPRTDCRYLNDEDYKDARTIVQHLLKQPLAFNTRFNAGTYQQSNQQQNQPDLSLQLNLDTKPRIFNSKKVENHAAIAPTTKSPNWSNLDAAKRKVYGLIARNYLCQFLPAYRGLDTLVSLHIGSKPWVFSTKCHQALVYGWKLLTMSATNYQNLTGNYFQDELEADAEAEGDSNSDSSSTKASSTKRASKVKSSEAGGINLSDQSVRNLKEGDFGLCVGIGVKERTTTPPTRYNEASLLRAMKNVARYVKNQQIKATLRETDGLGTEATRAAIIDKLYQYSYCEKLKNNIVPTEIGMGLIASLPNDLAQPDRTAYWEQFLSKIEKGEASFTDFMNQVAQGIQQLVQEVSYGNFSILGLVGSSPSKSTKSKTTYSKSSYSKSTTKRTTKRSTTSKVKASN